MQPVGAVRVVVFSPTCPTVPTGILVHSGVWPVQTEWRAEGLRCWAAVLLWGAPGETPAEEGWATVWEGPESCTEGHLGAAS